ncbi:MAG: hypothetical protein MK538_13315, partial [Planctomycetes bacterium]|nr:hypothetical protein [Planctomycetota bacterium]
DQGFDPERVIVAHAFVGRDTPLVRRRYHSMSRGGRVHKPRSRLKKTSAPAIRAPSALRTVPRRIGVFNAPRPSSVDG